jgi:hypothetical protein
MRTPIVLLSSFVAIALGSATVVAQERPASVTAAPAASLPMDCSDAVKRHDHGAERNAPSAKPLPCAPADAASRAKVKTKPVHDHGKFHKNQ